MSYRESILTGAKQATRLHDQLRTKERIEQTGGRIDVFGSALQLDATVIFRNLTGILGAYMREGGINGILVTTQRRLQVQRFTGAHEMGHCYMGHTPGIIDGEEILGGQGADLAPVEIEANGFAAEFMAPRWLLAYHASRQGWNAASITQPAIIYQLALRIGLSYEATCRSLVNHQLVSVDVGRALRDVPVKEIKREIVPAEYAPEKWYGDVWLLTERDRGARLEGHPDDLFVLKLAEKSTAGYLWNIDALRAEGFDILTDHGIDVSQTTLGAEVLREVTAGGAKNVMGQVSLQQRRPWEHGSAPLAELTLSYDLAGKEEGYSRVLRKKINAA